MIHRPSSSQSLRIFQAFLLLMLVAKVGHLLLAFHFQYTDSDQALMWYGVHEFREGRFHMPRYFGQSYGSMLEALMATPFFFLPHHVVLPLVSAVMLLLPFVLSAYSTAQPHRWLLLLVFLLAMPTEFYMMGFMPRDWVAGLAIGAFAMFWAGKNAGDDDSLQRSLPRDRHTALFVAFFAVLAWSVNAGSGLFTVAIIAYHLMQQRSYSRGTWQGVVAGVALAMGVHLLAAWYMHAHADLIVHQQWVFHYGKNQIIDGWTNLDRHLGWITPWAHSQGWMWIPLLLAVAWFGRHRHRSVSWTALLLLVLLFGSLGILKVHDGRDNVFFPHERMFLAIPVVFFFLLSRLSLRPWLLIALGAVSVLGTTWDAWRWPEKVAFHLDEQRDHVVYVERVEEVHRQALTLNRWCDSLNIEVVVAEPGCSKAAILDYAFPALGFTTPILEPGYERKQWEMQALDTACAKTILWVTAGSASAAVEHLKRVDQSSALQLDPCALPGMFEAVVVRSDRPQNPVAFFRAVQGH